MTLDRAWSRPAPREVFKHSRGCGKLPLPRPHWTLQLELPPRPLPPGWPRQDTAPRRAPAAALLLTLGGCVPAFCSFAHLYQMDLMRFPLGLVFDLRFPQMVPKCGRRGGQDIRLPSVAEHRGTASLRCRGPDAPGDRGCSQAVGQTRLARPRVGHSQVTPMGDRDAMQTRSVAGQRAPQWGPGAFRAGAGGFAGDTDAGLAPPRGPPALVWSG